VLWYAVRGKLQEYSKAYPDDPPLSPALIDAIERALLYERYHWNYLEVELTPLTERKFLTHFWLDALAERDSQPEETKVETPPLDGPVSPDFNAEAWFEQNVLSDIERHYANAHYQVSS
jgi:hypothetical protein